MKVKLNFNIKSIFFIVIIIICIIIAGNIISNFKSYTTRMGIIDKNENTIVDYKYIDIDALDLHSNQRYIKADKYELLNPYINSNKIKKVYIDLNGNEYNKGDIVEFYDNRAIDYNENNEKYGYIDENEKKITDYIYDKAYDFEDGIALVGISDKYGLIDKEGNQIISCSYDSVTICSKKFFYVELDNKFYLINDSEEKLGVVYVNEDTGLTERILFYNINDINIEQELEIDDEVMLSSNRIIIKDNEKYGIFDKTGVKVTDFMYDEFELLANSVSSDEIFRVLLDGKAYLIDESGNIINDVSGEDIEIYSNNLLTINENGKYGVQDVDGNNILNIEYDEILIYENYIVARKNAIYEICDITGKLLFTTKNPLNIFGNGNYFISVNYNKYLVMFYSVVIIVLLLVMVLSVKKILRLNKKER